MNHLKIILFPTIHKINMGTRSKESVTLQTPKSGQTIQQEADNSSIPPQDADRTINPADVGGVSKGQGLGTVV
jgi:hypothetical protein